MNHPVRLLLIEDNPADAELVKRELRKSGIDADMEWVQNRDGFVRALANPPDVVLADYSVPGMDGLAAMRLARERTPDVPVVMVSGAIGEEFAIETLKSGATDYVLKQRLSRLGPVVRRALQDYAAAVERRQAEDRLRKTMEELKRSNEELEQFAYVASHDLQEPLRMVSNYVELLGQRYRGRLDEKADKYIDYAAGGAKRMQELIIDLLTFSRVGRREMKAVAVDLDHVFRLALDNLEATVDEAGAEVTSSTLPTVVGDELALVQLFQNLIDNGIKFRSKEPPAVRVEAETRGRGSSLSAFPTTASASSRATPNGSFGCSSACIRPRSIPVRASVSRSVSASSSATAGASGWSPGRARAPRFCSRCRRRSTHERAAQVTVAGIYRCPSPVERIESEVN